MAESSFLTYKNKPLVRKGNEIYYGDMTEKYVVRFKILSSKKEFVFAFIGLLINFDRKDLTCDKNL